MTAQDQDRPPHSPIDLVEYGRLQGQVASLQLQVSQFELKQSKMDAKLDAMLRQFDESKGALRTLIWIFGGGGAAAGGVVAWMLNAWVHRGGQ